MRHNVDAHGATPEFSCEVCGEDFPIKSDLDRHRETVHEGNKKVRPKSSIGKKLRLNISKNESLILKLFMRNTGKWEGGI